MPGNGNTDIVPVSTTLVSGTELSITVNTSDLNSAEEPYDVRVVKASGLSAIAQNVLYVDNKPVWSITPNQTIKTVYAIFRGAVNIQLPTAVDPDGDVVTYAATNLPSGLTANSTTGLISGSLADVSSDTTYSPTVKALSTGSDPGATQIETTRTVNIVQKAGIGNSLRFDGSSCLTRTPTDFTGTSTTTWTWSVWVKNTSDSIVTLFDTSEGNSEWVLRIGDSSLTYQHWNGSVTLSATSQALYRDYSAWMHIVMRADTTNSQADKRINFFVNGKEVSSSYTGIGPSVDLGLNVNRLHAIGKRPSYNDRYSKCYKANIQFIDGQALSASDFGESVNGIWVPKTYLGTYGTNGFWLRFDDSSQIGKDSSGRGNHWTAI